MAVTRKQAQALGEYLQSQGWAVWTDAKAKCCQNIYDCDERFCSSCGAKLIYKDPDTLKVLATGIREALKH